MQPRITISVANLQGSAEEAEQALASAVGGTVTQYGATRGGIGDVLNLIADISGPATMIADKLLGVAKNAMAGAELTVKAEGLEVDLKNVPRDKLVEVLQMVIDASKDQ